MAEQNLDEQTHASEAGFGGQVKHLASATKMTKRHIPQWKKNKIKNHLVMETVY